MQGIAGVATAAVLAVSAQSWACSPQPWSNDPCRRTDLPLCYYDWTTTRGDGRLGTCTSVLIRCEGEFQAMLDLCNKIECSKDVVAYAAKNLQMTARALRTVCSHTGVE
jgi:hypothetical protein